uniref:Uncharacterized protein n=1 Tax=Arundo donax TaxID=35708 RepID=A0A0A9A627_ARUDO
MYPTCLIVVVVNVYYVVDT